MRGHRGDAIGWDIHTSGKEPGNIFVASNNGRVNRGLFFSFTATDAVLPMTLPCGRRQQSAFHTSSTATVNRYSILEELLSI